MGVIGGVLHHNPQPTLSSKVDPTVLWYGSLLRNPCKHIFTTLKTSHKTGAHTSDHFKEKSRGYNNLSPSFFFDPLDEVQTTRNYPGLYLEPLQKGATETLFHKPNLVPISCRGMLGVFYTTTAVSGTWDHDTGNRLGPTVFCLQGRFEGQA